MIEEVIIAWLLRRGWFSSADSLSKGIYGVWFEDSGLVARRIRKVPKPISAAEEEYFLIRFSDPDLFAKIDGLLDD